MNVPQRDLPAGRSASRADAMFRPLYLLRYHRPAQFYWRFVHQVRRRLLPFAPEAFSESADPANITLRGTLGLEKILNRRLAARLARPGYAARVTELQQGVFRLLEEERRLGMPVDWSLASVPQVSHLWRFHLHYQEYLLDLLAACRSNACAQSRRRMWEIVSDWITQNPLTRRALDDAWHPFCLSRRIPVWLLMWHAAPPPDELRDEFATSLERQARYLETHLERDLGGNHLLENLRALVLMGATLESHRSDERLDLATRQFLGQLEEQILEGGEHFERCPMYHAIMLEAVLDVRDATEQVRPQVSQRCREFAGGMSRLLSAILHPDGEIPLLGDSALGESIPGRTLVSETDLPGSERDSGLSPVAVATGTYWTWRDGEGFLVFDAGPVGADDLPAHAHCDLLTLEASFGGRRLFVDSGVMEYDGPTRAYCRSTVAHNVLQIDDAEQCDVWSRFRMGYRGRPTSFQCGDANGFSWSRATHNAFSRVQVPLVGRWLACRSGGPWLCVDWAEGKGRRRLTSRLHLHPDVSVGQQTDATVNLRIGEECLRLELFSPGRVHHRPAPYFPQFGRRMDSSVIELTTDCELPGALVWGLTWGDVSGRATHSFQPGGRQSISWCEDDSVATWEIGAG